MLKIVITWAYMPMMRFAITPVSKRVVGTYGAKMTFFATWAYMPTILYIAIQGGTFINHLKEGSKHLNLTFALRYAVMDYSKSCNSGCLPVHQRHEN